MSLTAERERTILAHLYGGDGEVWIKPGPSMGYDDDGNLATVFISRAPEGALLISLAELRSLHAAKLAFTNYECHSQVQTTANGRDHWRRMGSPKPEGL